MPPQGRASPGLSASRCDPESLPLRAPAPSAAPVLRCALRPCATERPEKGWAYASMICAMSASYTMSASCAMNMAWAIARAFALACAWIEPFTWLIGWLVALGWLVYLVGWLVG